eukprot:TRINITY_DN2448_c0_g1_i5.p1 TRINITY_DN2448_c0_g1~~TRINITY_DN2448_c0_g1_i5.p1  ORF type:complete len:367 (-),score=73.80 TRINITY_DN2448_c0_g1_i5:226-1326(-)
MPRPSTQQSQIQSGSIFSAGPYPRDHARKDQHQLDIGIIRPKTSHENRPATPFIADASKVLNHGKSGDGTPMIGNLTQNSFRPENTFEETEMRPGDTLDRLADSHDIAHYDEISFDRDDEGPGNESFHNENSFHQEADHTITEQSPVRRREKLIDNLQDDHHYMERTTDHLDKQALYRTAREKYLKEERLAHANRLQYNNFSSQSLRAHEDSVKFMKEREEYEAKLREREFAEMERLAQQQQEFQQSVQDILRWKHSTKLRESQDSMRQAELWHQEAVRDRQIADERRLQQRKQQMEYARQLLEQSRSDFNRKQQESESLLEVLSMSSRSPIGWATYARSPTGPTTYSTAFHGRSASVGSVQRPSR